MVRVVSQAQDRRHDLAQVGEQRRGHHRPDGGVAHHGDRMRPPPATRPSPPSGYVPRRAWPPRWREWERATASRPSAKTIERRWGWRELLAEAIGTQANQVDVSWETLLDARVQAMLAALASVRDELGRWPTAAEWDRSGRQPSARTLRRHLGSWAQACRAAERSCIVDTE
jgi:hypothetical protein